MTEFKVYTFEEDDITKDKKYKSLIHPIIGEHPRMILIGPSQAGKTQMIHNILWNWCKDYYTKSEDSRIIVISGTDTTIRHISKMADKLKLDEEQLLIMDFLDFEELKSIYKGLNPKVPHIFIFDDMAYNHEMNTNHRTNFLSELFASGRHKNTGCIIATQKYHFLGRDVRMLNSTLVSIYWNCSDGEIWKVYDDNFSQYINTDDFKDLVYDNLNEKYSFILLNKKTGKIYNNKMKEIYSKF